MRSEAMQALEDLGRLSRAVEALDVGFFRPLEKMVRLAVASDKIRRAENRAKPYAALLEYFQGLDLPSYALGLIAPTFARL